jgi:outer membrane protein, multidrug efflux system
VRRASQWCVGTGMRRAARAAAAALAIAAVSACAVAPVPTKPAGLPDLGPAFAQAPAGAGRDEPAERFWRAFGDADLDTLVGDALAANVDLRLAAARVQEVRALARLAGAGDLPAVGLGASAARIRAPDTAGVARTDNAFGTGLEVRWEADLFGRRADEQRAAAADLRATEFAAQAARLSVASEVARQYFELRGLQERLRVAQEALDTQRAALRLVEGRLEAGRGTALDTERARALVLGTEATVPALQLQLALTRQRLALLTGRPPQALDATLEAPRPLPGLKAVPLAAIGSPESLLRRRPDLQAAEQQAQAAAARVGATHKARWPSLSLGGTLGLNAGRVADLGNSASFVYNLGASLAFSLFDNGAAAARVGAAQARELSAAVTYEGAVLNALQEAEGALLTYTRTQQQSDSLFNAVIAADRAAQIARGRFEAGASDFLAVLDAERERLAARDRLAVAQTAAAVSVVGVYRALAGGVGEGR